MMKTYWIIFGVAATFLIVLVLMWLAWKFFSKLFKYIVVALLIVMVGSGLYLYRSLRPQSISEPVRDPAIGKHAYLTGSGEYLGVVEGSADDTTRGKVWIIRPPGRSPSTYGKSLVTLKDRRDTESEPKPSPTAVVKPRRRAK